jgi:uncharacterized cupin superfamily protein
MSLLEVSASSLAGHDLAPAGSKLVLLERTTPGTADARYQVPLHSHEEDEAWYVLDGTLRFRVGDDQVDIPAGGAVVVPGGTAHTFSNPLPEPARFVLVQGPRTEALVRAIHDGSERNLVELGHCTRRTAPGF